MKTCPYCAEETQDAAVKCKHCGSDLGSRRSNAPKKGKESPGCAAWGGGCALSVALFVACSIALTLAGNSIPRIVAVLGAIAVGAILSIILISKVRPRRAASYIVPIVLVGGMIGMVGIGTISEELRRSSQEQQKREAEEARMAALRAAAPINYAEGVGYLEEERYQESIDKFLDVREANPHYEEVVSKLALAYMGAASAALEDDAFEMAARHCESAREVSPTTPGIDEKLTEIYVARFASRVDEIGTLLDESKLEEALRKLIRLSSEENKLGSNEATRHFETLAGRMKETCLVEADTLLARNEDEQALDVLSLSLDAFPGDEQLLDRAQGARSRIDDSRFDEASALILDGKFGEALDLLNAILASTPEYDGLDDQLELVQSELARKEKERRTREDELRRRRAKQSRAENETRQRDVSGSEVFRVACDFVRAQLKAPRSAKFPGDSGIFDVADPRDYVRTLGNDKYRVRAWVDAENAFGAMLRTHWTAVVRREKGRWRLEELDFDR